MRFSGLSLDIGLGVLVEGRNELEEA